MFRNSLLLMLCTLLLLCCPPEPENGIRDELTIDTQVKGAGRIESATQNNTIYEGDTLHFRAVADSGSLFYGWSVDTFITGNPLDVIAKKNMIIIALFAPAPEAMCLIDADDSPFTMGSSESGAPESERPLHSVIMTYNYHIAEHEVTRGEYRVYMPLPAGTVDNDSLPISGITWYDAVLYCNQISKCAGYDTVYTYTSRCRTAGECPYILENIEIHYERFGFRLPTEAEWEYGCRAGSTARYFWGDDQAAAAQYAWSFENAENTVHPVGRLAPNKFGLYDICGNVAEFVNDRLWFYTDSLSINPVGPLHQTEEQFIVSGERPLKGGSYRLTGAAYLRPSVRKGPYTMTATALQVDVGFRVALGAFAAKSSLPAFVVDDSIDVNVVCNKSDLLAGIGTNSVKVAFVHSSHYRQKCMLADFDQSPVKIVPCSSDTLVVAPTISPDGNYIAWGSKEEGARGVSTITVRALRDTFPITSSLKGFLPRWWVDPGKKDTFLLFTDGASHDDEPQWMAEKTLRQKMIAGVPVGAPEIVWERGSFHGGMSSDGRFIGTGYPVAKLIDMQLNDSNLFYFRTPWNGRDDNPQVCNFSMSPSLANPGEVLFLDFGYPKTSTLLGKPYGFHAVIFIATTLMLSDKHVAEWYEIPGKYDQWNYTEFTNHPGIIAAIAQKTGEAACDVVMLVDRMDSNYIEVLEGKNLRDVAVWIDPRKAAEIDDPFRHFGKYDVPIQTSGHVTLARKLRLLWHERENVQCIAIGNSPMLYGFDPHSITALPTINIAWYQNCLGGSVAVASQYILPIVPACRVILLDLDASYLTFDSKLLPRITGLSYTKGYELDSSKNFYRDSIPIAVKAKAAAFTTESWKGFDAKGAFLDSVIGEGWGEPIIEGKDYSLEDTIVRENIAMLEELIGVARSKNIKVLVINFPQNPRYKETDMAGRFGPKWMTYQKLSEIVTGLTKKYDNFHFYDAHNGGNHDYASGEAKDANHLNARGGKKIAERVDSLLQVIIK